MDGFEMQMNERSVHRLLPTDTLAGLALRYNTTQENLLLMNGLISEDMLHTLSEVQVPRVEGGQAQPSPSRLSQADAVRQFVAQANCSSFEAKTYLKAAAFDVDAALADRERWLSRDAAEHQILAKASLTKQPAAASPKTVARSKQMELEQHQDLLFSL